MNKEITDALKKHGFNYHTASEGKLMALELLVKAGAGYINSYTEECFLSELKLLKRNREPNKKGLRFICDMIYESSNKRAYCFEAMKQFRK